MSTDTKVLENVKAEEVARQMLDGELPVAEDEPGMIHIGGVKVRADVWDAFMESIEQIKPLEPKNTYAYRGEGLGWYDASEPDGVTQFGGVGYTRGYCSPGRGYEYTGGKWYRDMSHGRNWYTSRDLSHNTVAISTRQSVTNEAPFVRLGRAQERVIANA